MRKYTPASKNELVKIALKQLKPEEHFRLRLWLTNVEEPLEERCADVYVAGIGKRSIAKATLLRVLEDKECRTYVQIDYENKKTVGFTIIDVDWRKLYEEMVRDCADA